MKNPKIFKTIGLTLLLFGTVILLSGSVKWNEAISMIDALASAEDLSFLLGYEADTYKSTAVWWDHAGTAKNVMKIGTMTLMVGLVSYSIGFFKSKTAKDSRKSHFTWKKTVWLLIPVLIVILLYIQGQNTQVTYSTNNASKRSSTTNLSSDIETAIPSDATFTTGKQLSEQETIDKMSDILALFGESLSAYSEATEIAYTHTLNAEEVSQIEEQIEGIAENISDNISSIELCYIPSSYFTSSWNKLIDCLIETSNIFKQMSVWDINGDGIVTGEEATSVLRAGEQRLQELKPSLNDVSTSIHDEINDNPNLQEYSSQNKSSSASTKPFTNKYGTSTTICAHTGCTNYIASSGDTNCCTTHSHKCANCGCYIDEDALFCLSCIANSLDEISSSKSSSKYICQATGCSKNGTCTITGISGQTEYYCYEHYAQILSWMDMFSGK